MKCALAYLVPEKVTMERGERDLCWCGLRFRITAVGAFAKLVLVIRSRRMNVVGLATMSITAALGDSEICGAVRLARACTRSMDAAKAG